jgi:hypothetical protein
MKPLLQLIPPSADPDEAIRTANREGVWVGIVIGFLLGALAVLLLLPVLR